MLRSKATKEPIGDFVKLVGVSADRPVLDKLGIKGYIDYDIIIYTQDARNNDDVNRAILDAVKDQLGLKLEPCAGFSRRACGGCCGKGFGELIVAAFDEPVAYGVGILKEAVDGAGFEGHVPFVAVPGI
jgi:hypothetical protein